MNFWYQRSHLARLLMWLLSPFSLLFYIISGLRRCAYRIGLLKSWRAPLPVVVIGNLSVGGNGKTPFTIWLAQELRQRGLKVGIISRGYVPNNQDIKNYPQLVTPNANPAEVGDEAVLMARLSGAKIAISPNRRQSIELLYKAYHIDVILSDDGLQHYALQRDIEVVIIDGQRRFGNGFVLPAGPLRELPARLKNIDAVICNGAEAQAGEIHMQLKAVLAVNLLTQEERPLSDFMGIPIVAMAAIGNPQRFFTMLQQQQLNIVKQKAFSDHATLPAEKLHTLISEEQALFMTEKDAVKYSKCAGKNWWYVPVKAQLPPEINHLITHIMQEVKR